MKYRSRRSRTKKGIRFTHGDSKDISVEPVRKFYKQTEEKARTTDDI